MTRSPPRHDAPRNTPDGATESALVRPYVGRFAPSPSGPLHFGSLIAAAASYFDARAAGGRWLLRIDDVDTPRCVAGAAEEIVSTLADFGFEWDGTPEWQSHRVARYAETFEQLRAEGLVYPCGCTRREIADSALAPDGARVYPGTCRDGLPAGREARAWRVRVEGHAGFDDAIQGGQREDLEREVGDFVLRRADGLFAYQLAVIVDDADAGVTDVVRGADLLSSTCRQIFLQRQLGLHVPRYAHLPVALSAAGEKLSKQTLARAITEHAAAPALHAALSFLGQRPPAELATAQLVELHEWAIENWRLTVVPKCLGLPAPAGFGAE